MTTHLKDFYNENKLLFKHSYVPPKICPVHSLAVSMLGKVLLFGSVKFINLHDSYHC